jgi:hypothetical protein
MIDADKNMDNAGSLKISGLPDDNERLYGR